MDEKPLPPSGSRNFSSSAGVLAGDDAHLVFSAPRARRAHRSDLWRRPSHGLSSDRVVPAGAVRPRLECEPGGASHACLRLAPRRNRRCGGCPSSSGARADRDAPTRDGWAGAPSSGVTALVTGHTRDAPPVPNAGWGVVHRCLPHRRYHLSLASVERGAGVACDYDPG
jgi:hypothetical protein